MKTVILVEDPETGDLIMPIPEDMWNHLGLSIGDTLTWTVKTNGTIILSKKESND
jgi:antitoxin component of MazEF toxin-antitoxin module